MPTDLYVVYLVLLGVFGLAFGSFANVVIWRLPRGESLSAPPSHCPNCEHPIRWYDNVPVLSWVLLRGRCRDCGTPISARYPLVELSSALLWVLAGILYGFSARTPWAIALFYVLLILSLIDIDVMRLPNPLVLLLAVMGFVGLLLAQFTSFDVLPITWAGGQAPTQPLVNGLVGLVLGGGLSLGIATLYSAVRNTVGFGMGDVKLLAAMGLYYGPFVLMVFFFGSLFGAILGLVLARSPEEFRAKRIPFGPMLALGALVTAVTGPALWGWYAQLTRLA